MTEVLARAWAALDEIRRDRGRTLVAAQEVTSAKP